MVSCCSWGKSRFGARWGVSHMKHLLFGASGRRVGSRCFVFEGGRIEANAHSLPCGFVAGGRL